MMTVTTTPSKTSARILARRSILLTFVALAGLLAGCHSSPTSDARPASTLKFNLASVDGNAVPARIQHGGKALEVRAGQLVIQPDGTCEARTVFVPPNGREITREVQATYRRNGTDFKLQWKGAGQTTGTLEADRFIHMNEGMRFEYRRE